MWYSKGGGKGGGKAEKALQESAQSEWKRWLTRAAKMLSPAGPKNHPRLQALIELQSGARVLPSPALLERSVYTSNSERISPKVFETLRTLNHRVTDCKLWIAQAHDMLSPQGPRMRPQALDEHARRASSLQVRV